MDKNVPKTATRRKRTPCCYVCFPLAYHVVGVEHFAQQLWNGTLGLHGGVALAQVHRHLQRALAVHQPGGHGQDALLHVGGRRQAAQLLEGHGGVLSGGEGQRTRVKKSGCVPEQSD